MWDTEQGLNSSAAAGLFPWGKFTIHINVLKRFSRDHRTTTIGRKAFEIVNDLRHTCFDPAGVVRTNSTAEEERERAREEIWDEQTQEERTVDAVAAVYQQLSS